jgi:hypothetical protein
MTRTNTTPKPRRLVVEAALETPFGRVATVGYCPVCGADLFSEHEPNPEMCEHIRWIEVDRSLIWLAPDLQALEAVDGQRPAPRRRKMLAAVANGNLPSVLVMRLTTGGMGCGPSWSTLSVAVDFAR